MRRTLWLTLCLLICVLTFSACDQGDKPSANDDTTTVCQHTFGDWNTTKQATCKDEGELVRICSKCSAEEKTTVAKTNVHTEVIDAAISATCEATGFTEGKHCSVCGVITVEQTTLPLASHTYDNDEDSRCNICDYVRDLNCQHTETEVLKAVTPTCTTSGLSEGAKCSSCGEIIVSQTSIPAKEHTPTTTAGYDATCTQTGLSDSKKCSVCGTELEKAIVIPIKPHEYTDKYDKSCNNCDFVRDAECAHTETITIEGKNATCTELGLTDGIKCTECGEILIAQTTVGALGHIGVIDAAVAPTCTESGLTEGKHCSRCNKTLVAQIAVGSLGHIEVADAAVAPTCIETGLTEGKHCSRCSTTLVAQTTVGSLGHIEVADSAVAPTCTDTGLTEGKHCSRCNATLVAQTTVGALGHAEVIDSAVAPTCTESGLTEGKHCSRCNATLVAQTTVGALGHTEIWVVDVEATCKNEGEKHKKCTICHEKLETSIIDKLNTHKSAEVIIENKIDYTCSQDGSYDEVVYCSVCDIEISRDSKTIPKMHQMVDGVCQFCGGAESSQGLVFEFDNDKNGYVLISIGDCVDNTIIVDLYNGYPVIEIGEKAFRENDDFENVIIGNKVTSIGSKAFQFCQGVKSVELGENVEIISEDAFYDCSSLQTISIPDTVISIGAEAFKYCDNLTNIFIGKGVQTLGKDAFYQCSSNLKNVVVSTENTYYCSVNNCLIEISTKTLILGSNNGIIPTDGSVTSISSYAFYGCIELEEITIPSSVKKINDWAFSYCKKLSKLTIENGVTTIGNSAFYNCSELLEISIPDSVTKIGDDAFSDCTSATTIKIGKGVTSIGDEAFADCPSIESISVIGNTTYWSSGNCLVKASTNTLILGCKNSIIPEPYYSRKITRIGAYAFAGCTELKSIVIPDSVTTIDEYAFSGCSSLESVTIGKEVTFISYGAFNGCKALTKATFTDTLNWYVSDPFSGERVLIEEDMSNTEIAAKYIKAAPFDCLIKIS